MKDVSNFRSQFKATSIKSLKKSIDEDDSMLGANSNDYLSLEDGKTIKIRIFPAHPGEDSFYIHRKAYWLSFNGSDGGTYRGRVNDSRIHGGTKMDIVDEYVKFAKKKYANDQEKMDALVGTGVNKNSLNPQYSWLCYADKVHQDEPLKAKLWEFKKMVRDGMNKLTFNEDEDDVITTDPFTDPDEGLPILVKYMKNPNKKKGENYYEVSFAKKPNPRPLTDKELEEFIDQKPLTEIIGKYGIKDFTHALEGLQNFDEENDMGLFDDDAWLEKVEDIKAQYDSEDSEEKKSSKKHSIKKVEKEEEEDSEEDEEKNTSESSEDEDEEEEDSKETDEFDDMDRTELKHYIHTKNLDVHVKKSMTDDDIRDKIREVTDSIDEEDPEDDSEEEDSEPKEKGGGKLTLEQIRKKLKNN